MTKVLYLIENNNDEYFKFKHVLEYLALLGTHQVYLVSDTDGLCLKYNATLENIYFQKNKKRNNLSSNESQEVKSLYKKLRELKLDIIHLINPTELRALRVCQKINVPLIITFLDFDSINHFKEKKYLFSSFNNSYVFTMGSDLRDQLNSVDYKDLICLEINPFKKDTQETEIFKFFCLYNLIVGNT